jgi:hypothetical protein
MRAETIDAAERCDARNITPHILVAIIVIEFE